MGTTRGDDLARRLAERMQQSQPRGRLMGEVPAERVPSSPTGLRPPARSTPPATRTPPAEVTPRQRSRPKPPAGKRNTSPAVPAAPATPAVPAGRLRRGASGTALRGHLVPDSVHAAGRRRKVELRADRGERITWDEVLREGITAMTRDPSHVGALLVEHTPPGAERELRRLVQATLPLELERRFLETHLALNEVSTTEATYEQLWTLAIQLWIAAST